MNSSIVESALVPADLERLLKQLEAVSNFVDTVLVYQYLGIMNKPQTIAFTGHPGSTAYYNEYFNWLQMMYPEMIKTHQSSSRKYISQM